MIYRRLPVQRNRSSTKRYYWLLILSTISVFAYDFKFVLLCFNVTFSFWSLLIQCLFKVPFSFSEPQQYYFTLQLPDNAVMK